MTEAFTDANEAELASGLPATSRVPEGEAALNYFTSESIDFIAAAVKRHQGQEILMGGLLDSQVRVKELTILAQGTRQMVPAVIESAKKYDVIIHNHPSALLKPSPADLHAAGVLSDYEVGFYIVTNDAKRVNVVTKSQKVKISTIQRLAPAAVLKFLDSSSPQSPIAEALPSYAFRENQATMMREVVTAFNEEQIYICEAPTGTGKSLAYLLPAMLWAKTNRTKVVIATNTILLQEQLLKKDLALVRKLTGFTEKALKVELVKGRNHYLCQNKFETTVGSASYQVLSETDSLIDRLDPSSDWNDFVAWGQKTEFGDFNELATARTQTFKADFCCEVDTCKRKFCTHNHDGKCFYGNARRRFFDADILIVNHHILIIDLIIKASQGTQHNAQGLLPAFDHLIIDEAHHLEEVALKNFGKEATRYSILKILNLIGTPSKITLAAEEDKIFKTTNETHAKSTKPRGILITIRNKLTHKVKAKNTENTKTIEIEPLLAQAEQILTQIDPLIDQFRTEHFKFIQREEEIFNALFHYLTASVSEGHRETTTARTSYSPLNQQFQKRIKEQTRLEATWQQFNTHVNDLLDHLSDIKECLQSIRKCLTGLDETFLQVLDLEININHFKAYDDRLAEVMTTFAALLKTDNTHEVKWLTGKKTKNRINIIAHCYKIDIKEQLAKELFAPLKALVMTSATLTIKNSFEFFKACMGFDYMEDKDKERICTTQIKPHFNYKKNCGFFMPAKFPNVDYPTFKTSAREVILEAVQFLNGRTLILFTSYKNMMEMKLLLASKLKEMGINLMMQGDFDRYTMINELKKSPATLLLGVSSFWEGVDIPGDHLSCLIMMRLPFPNFSEPIIEARIETLKQSGKNHFTELLLPQAILKYKQGFGRLIRNETDRGLFVLLDRRFINKPYGVSFKQSLPPLKHLTGATFTACAEDFWKET
ncbi:putative ATP-dependent helicase DinG [Spirochaetota bacterium]|nr:putative ATP-dependent helicase DinG [Spirochaetota bacterium]